MTPAAHFRPGDEVRIRLASRVVRGEVLEDRGPLGPAGEHVLRVAWMPTDSEDRVELEVRESQVAKHGQGFEEQVEQVLRGFAGLKVKRPEPDSAGWIPDFLVETPRGQIVVEAKSFPGGGAPRDVGRIEAKLLEIRNNLDADVALLVVPAWNRVLMRRDRREGLEVVPLASLQDWLEEYMG